MDDTARLLVTVLLAAFVIERVVATVAFLTETPKGPERNATIYRFLLTAVLGAIAVWLAHIRILERLNNSISPWVDYPLSWLVLVAGADKIRDLVGGSGGGAEASAKPELPPIQINITDKDGKTTVHELKAN
jgi:hypothetical protein